MQKTCGRLSRAVRLDTQPKLTVRLRVGASVDTPDLASGLAGELNEGSELRQTAKRGRVLKRRSARRHIGTERAS